MLTAYGSTESDALKRKARSIELQASRSAPSIAKQLRSLAAEYYMAAELPSDRFTDTSARRGAALTH